MRQAMTARMTKVLERRLKQAGLFLLRLVARPPGAPPTAADLERVSRILVVRPDERIGNAVLLTPLLVALKGRFSRAELVCLISRRYWDLHPHLPSADEFMAFEKKRTIRNPFTLWRSLRNLRARRFDLVFDAAGDHEVSFTHLLLTALSGGRFRIGHARVGVAGFYEVAVPVPAAPRHAAEMHLDLLRAVTPIRSHPCPMLRPRPDSGFAERFRRDAGWDSSRPVVVIHPGARGRKRWAPEDWVAVAQALHTGDNMHVAMVWGPADTETAAAVMQSGYVRAAGILPFADLLSLVRSASAFVAADSGPMQLVAAAGVPVVAIFLSSDPVRYRPLGPRHVVLDGRAAPVTPAMVTEAIRTVIASEPDTAARVVTTPTEGST